MSKIKEKKILGVGWVPHSSRLDEIMKTLDGESVKIKCPKREMRDFSKLVYFTKMTHSLIKERKPDVIVAQNPPTFCPVIVYFCMKQVNPKGIIIVDNHALAVEMGKRSVLWRILSIFEKYVLKRAQITTVTHEIYHKKLSQIDIKSLVFYDMIPEYIGHDQIKQYDFICPFGGHEDEDINQVIKLAQRFEKKKIIVTGIVNPDIDFPVNVEYKGFLSKEEYIEMLFKSKYGLCPIKNNEMTFPYVLFDFLSVGIPFFVTRNKILERHVESELLYTQNDELIQKIERLDDETYEKKLAKKTEIVKTKFLTNSTKSKEVLLKTIKSIIRSENR